MVQNILLKKDPTNPGVRGITARFEALAAATPPPPPTAPVNRKPSFNKLPSYLLSNNNNNNVTFPATAVLPKPTKDVPAPDVQLTQVTTMEHAVESLSIKERTVPVRVCEKDVAPSQPQDVHREPETEGEKAQSTDDTESEHDLEKVVPIVVEVTETEGEVENTELEGDATVEDENRKAEKFTEEEVSVVEKDEEKAAIDEETVTSDSDEPSLVDGTHQNETSVDQTTSVPQVSHEEPQSSEIDLEE